MKNEANDSASDLASASTWATGFDDSFVQVEKQMALDLSVSPKNDVIGEQSGISKTLACVTIRARELPEEDDDKRAAVDIVVCLDVSDSMAGNKLAQCKRTLTLLLRMLGSQDTFGLISYSADAAIEIPAQKMTPENKKAALSKINALTAFGLTNISAAIGLAAQELKLIENPNRVRSIFLLTDGCPTSGITSASDIAELTKNCLDSELSLDGLDLASHEPTTGHQTSGGFLGAFLDHKGADYKPDCIPVEVSTNEATTIHCFGYGGDHDSQLLRDVAGAIVGGTYYHVENDSNVGAAFGDALGGILSVVAQNVVATIKVSPESSELGAAIVDVHHDQKVKRSNGSYTVTVGDFYAEECKDIVFELALANTNGSSPPKPIPHALVSLSYTDTIRKQLVATPCVSCSIVRPRGSQVSEDNRHVAVQWLRIAATTEMTAAERLGAQNDLKGARASIGFAQATFRSADATVRAHPVAQQIESELEQAVGGLASEADYAAYGSAFLRTRTMTHQTQRCQESTPESRNVYRSSIKMRLAKKFRPSG